MQAQQTIHAIEEPATVPVPLRSINDIIADLSKPIAERHIKTRQQGKQDIAYLEWHVVSKFLDFYSPGWQFEIRSIQELGELVVITGRLSIPCTEGIVYRESCGSEPVDTKAFGDSVSIAEQMSFKRCAARFGLGLSFTVRGNPKWKSESATQASPWLNHYGSGSTAPVIVGNGTGRKTRTAMESSPIAASLTERTVLPGLLLMEQSLRAALFVTPVITQPA